MNTQGLKQRQRYVLSAKNQFTKQQQLIQSVLHPGA